jgi:hypothetical protein
MTRRAGPPSRSVLVPRVQPQPLAALRRSAVLEEIGEENLCATVEAALARAGEELEVRRLLGDGSGRHEVVA